MRQTPPLPSPHPPHTEFWIAYGAPLLAQAFLFFTPELEWHSRPLMYFSWINQESLTGTFIIIFEMEVYIMKILLLKMAFKLLVRPTSIVRLSVCPAQQACGTEFPFIHWERSLVERYNLVVFFCWRDLPESPEPPGEKESLSTFMNNKHSI